MAPGTMSACRILVVDDDPAVLCLVCDKLRTAGYEVWAAASGAQALSLIGERGPPHLAIVDVNMPGMDGFTFCETVQASIDLPVIMLTAVDAEETVIRGIQFFAEDYVTKPFSPRELLARVDRVLRRMGDLSYALGPEVRIDDGLALDFGHQRALLDGSPVSLTPTETKLLYILFRNIGCTVSTGFLLRRLWPMDEVYEDRLRVHVHRLRHKIEPDPSDPRYLVTDRGAGYRLVSSN
ncbi:MAG: response regulator transcription factor [Anaerolineae bacterium]|nr:response regulator transcription factor [Anaerolineae bacterium]